MPVQTGAVLEHKPRVISDTPIEAALLKLQEVIQTHLEEWPTTQPFSRGSLTNILEEKVCQIKPLAISLVWVRLKPLLNLLPIKSKEALAQKQESHRLEDTREPVPSFYQLLRRSL